jgi:hypothetical protein
MACLLVYVFSYLALLQPTQPHAISAHGRLYYERVASYNLGGVAAGPFFAPLHLLDQQVRASYWHWQVPYKTPDLDIPVRTK